MQLVTHPVLCAFKHNHMMMVMLMMMIMMVMMMTISTMVMIIAMMMMLMMISAMMMMMMSTMMMISAMMMMMLTMPTGSDTESGFYIGRWMERPVVNHFRVFLLRLSIIITVIYDHFDL